MGINRVSKALHTQNSTVTGACLGREHQPVSANQISLVQRKFVFNAADWKRPFLAVEEPAGDLQVWFWQRKQQLETLNFQLYEE
jgi:hypothetical protein